ncbi:DUF1194 domain-containing protein [Peteryoungia desertarenae]|uniref:DUF1194 domain-containing protein n=1 Tax=Peteryoungia desertarenae TaxID=1813451 RepID=A0ABX6QJR3_9HYPH|nr:DUF1194 domain-containing protein [Peteryoungia desertarenae]QLF68794.1 DUF1194 domain-containing protein [Peteryoungia desertarenae]
MLATLAMFLSLSTAPALQSSIRTGTTEVDVELILAVDVSRSMDWDELQVQRAGYIAALQHPDFINAIQNGLIGQIAVAYYEWAGGVYTDAVVDWQIISNAEEAADFAAKLQAHSQTGLRGTSISSAIEFGANLFDQNDYQGLRQVIDVSGDGPNNRGLPVAPSRDKALSEGIIINGLAIMIRPSMAMVPLDKYYADCVIGGPGAFVLPVKKIEDFAPAIRRKLVMEISGLLPAEAIPASVEQATDCMIGEKIRNDWDNR